MAAIQELDGAAGNEADDLVEEIENKPEKYQPPVLSSLANYLYKNGKVDDAIFWLNAGRLRGNYDVSRCTDESAGEVMATLASRVLPDLRKAQFADINKFRRIVMTVIQWDKDTPHSYDQRWVNLYGIKAMTSALGDEEKTPRSLSVPRKEWDELADRARTDFQSSFEAAMKKRSEK